MPSHRKGAEGAKERLIHQEGHGPLPRTETFKPQMDENSVSRVVNPESRVRKQIRENLRNLWIGASVLSVLCHDSFPRVSS